jgi:hypothetical protein
MARPEVLCTLPWNVPVSRGFACALSCAYTDRSNPNENATAATANTVLTLRIMMMSPLRLVFDEHRDALSSHGQ